ncbi:alpha/beta fold hydrolase [Actinomadura oligospora]|uniref:alpha/beta fold hydrolase n=1 Tax=Actinomadura oligospora TaxID=111804 RepID=UPI0004AD9259|nr:alpha/beta fold hydrolase [Actinomadura oligospora]
MPGHTPANGILGVPGAHLYYEVRGSGPALLVIATGNGDADPFGFMADLLADRYTVITYDRRGFSRSPQHEAVPDERRVDTDVADAVALLDHLTVGPAHVLGTCSGGVTALALLAASPERIRTLVTHEPPLTSLLPDADEWAAFYDRLYDVYRTEGVDPAKEIFKDTMGLGETRPPKGAELPPERLAAMLERLRVNQVFWFEHELRVFTNHELDVDALKAAADRLVLAGGTASRDDVNYRPNLALAERLGLEVVDFPGGHLGYVTHPHEFAETLDRVLRPNS